ncbi:phage late control D family protein [Methylorubrum aminovorans]
MVEIAVTLGPGGGEQDICSITLDDRDWKIASPVAGRKLEIYLGYREVGLAQQNVFEIKTVEYVGPPRSIKITGTAVGFMSTLKVRAIKEFDGQTLGDIIGDIARKGGVSPMVETSLAQIKVPFLNQTTSSLHLLQELERRYGAIAKFDSGKLVFVPRDSNDSMSGIAMPVLLLRPEHLAQWSVRHDHRGAHSSVKAAYVDADTHQPVWIEEKNPHGPTNEQGQPEDMPFRLPTVYPTKDQARAAMRSTLSMLRRSMGEANLALSKGDPWVRSNQRIHMTGMRDGINGQYQADTVTHTYTKEAGLLTTILAKPPGDGLSYGDAGISNDNVFSPSAGSKLGARFVPPAFDAA